VKKSTPPARAGARLALVLPEWPDADPHDLASISRRNDWWQARVIDRGLVLTPLAYALLLRYVATARDDGTSPIQTARIAQHLGKNPGSVVRADNLLADAKLIDVERRVNDRTVHLVGWVARGVALDDVARGVARPVALPDQEEDYYSPEDLHEEVVADGHREMGVARDPAARGVAQPDEMTGPEMGTGTRSLLKQLGIDADGVRVIEQAIEAGKTSHARAVAVHANLSARGKANDSNAGLARTLILNPDKGLARPTGTGGTVCRTEAEVEELRREGDRRRQQIAAERMQAAETALTFTPECVIVGGHVMPITNPDAKAFWLAHQQRKKHSPAAGPGLRLAQ
jgi:hypothetical protein